MNRRYFIKSGGIALASFGLMTSTPTFLRRALAETIDQVTGGKRKTLIAIFQRGAADGLNIVVPHGEKAYYDLRPTIAIPRPTANGDKAADARPGKILASSGRSEDRLPLFRVGPL